MFGSNRDYTALKKRMKALEDELEEVAADISTIRSTLRRVVATKAVTAKKSQTTEQKLLNELLGGKVIAVQEPITAGTSDGEAENAE